MQVYRKCFTFCYKYDSSNNENPKKTSNLCMNQELRFMTKSDVHFLKFAAPDWFSGLTLVPNLLLYL